MSNNDIENQRKLDVYWFVGASFEEGDQTERFIDNGIWENGYTDKNLDLVRSMNAGDTILIKSTYTRKYGLPFDNREHSVSVMLIKAIGTIVENYGDGRTIKVDWGQGILSKDEWYFYTYQPTIWKVTADNWKKKALIDFSVNNTSQDIDRFRNHGFWKDRFGDIDKSHQAFEWTEFYEELAEKLLQYKDNRKPLVEFILQLAEKYSLLYVQGKDLQDICPFTVFGLFNRGITHTSRTKIAQELADFLQVSIIAPNTFAGIPLLNNQKSWFFAFEEERQPKDIDQLWEIFELAQISLNDESNSLEIQKKLLEQYDLVSSQNQIGWNLSMGLYWIRPWNYLTLDQQSQKYIVEKLKIKINKSSSKQRCTGAEYFDLLSTLESFFQEDDYPIHSFPELSLEAYGGKVENNRESSVDEKMGSSTKKILNKYELTNVILYGPPGTGKTYKTVEKAVEICDPAFLASIKSEDGHILDRNSLKTRYDDLIENKQISFVTFHQSFSYEDFVEGIRAKTENGQIEYLVEDGIFKKVSKLASQKILSNVWKLAFVDGQYQNKKIEQECLENNYILLRYSNSFNKDDDTVVVDTKYRQDMESSFMDEMQIGDLVLISDGVKNIRAIAEITSETKLLENIDRDTYKIKRDVKWLSKFDQSISNEDIITQKFKHDALYLIDQSILKIDGLQKVINKNLVLNESKKNHVLIIDEINRGNIANIFGELITLLEPSKRSGNDDARSVTLPYSKESFSVPNNLHVIGTMNTSDHSLTKLDLALRRRFEFVELLPNYELLKEKITYTVYGVEIWKLLNIMNDRIEVLLGRDYLIGHSYFLELEGLTEEKQQEKLANIFKNKIIPLLQEYFFEDWERIQWVLNDQNKAKEIQFIHMAKDNQDIERLFKNVEGLSLTDRRYQVNESAFKEAEAYLKIFVE